MPQELSPSSRSMTLEQPSGTTLKEGPHYNHLPKDKATTPKTLRNSSFSKRKKKLRLSKTLAKKNENSTAPQTKNGTEKKTLGPLGSAMPPSSPQAPGQENVWSLVSYLVVDQKYRVPKKNRLPKRKIDQNLWSLGRFILTHSHLS